MNNIEITKKLGEYTGFGIGKCKFLLKTLNEILVDALRKGQEISLLSLGKIKIAKTKKLSSNAEKVTIKKIAKKVADTKKGDLSIFCKTTDKIIVATGMAKNINKLFIHILLFIFFIYSML